MPKEIKWEYTYNSDNSEEKEKYSGTYKVKGWSIKDRMQANDEAMEIKDLEAVRKNQTDGMGFSNWKFALRKFLSCLVEAPFPINEKEIASLPVEVFDDINEEINKVTALKKVSEKNYTAGQ